MNGSQPIKTVLNLQVLKCISQDDFLSAIIKPIQNYRLMNEEKGRRAVP